MKRETAVKTPYFLVDEERLVKNLELLKEIQEETGCRILLAQKAFSGFFAYPLMRRYLAGTTASGLCEARLGKEEFGGETHVFSPAYREDEFEELLSYADHFVFNSPAQLRRYGEKAKQAGKSVGLRVNPECSTQEGHAIYDPCAPGSRLGTVKEQFDEALLPMLDGLHFHTLCEQNSDDLETTAQAFEEKFGRYLGQMKWVNFGGGHHVSSVLETMKNGMDIAILDTSAACHMPDVLEMPYRPPVLSSGMPGEKEYTYRLAGPTCLAGDVIGDYSFDHPLEEGEQVVFGDMALYTMVKTNTFNGMLLPSIVWKNRDGEEILIKEFGYEDFKGRLG